MTARSARTPAPSLCLVLTALLLAGVAGPASGEAQPSAQDGDASSSGNRPDALPDYYESLPRDLQIAAAAETGWTERVRKMLDQGMSVETTYSGRTLLHAAIAGVTHWGDGGHPRMVELLLARGANPNRPFPPGNRLAELMPLYVAFLEYSFVSPRAEKEIARRRRIVEILFDFGARLERSWVDSRYPNPLDHAADKCDAALVRRLLETDFDLTKAGGTAPPIEVSCYNTEIVRLLLDHGAEPTPRFIKDILSDHDANWKAEIAHWLLDEGVDPAQYDFVRFALFWKDYELLKKSLSFGADPDEYPNTGLIFPLAYAVKNGDKQAVEILLDAGANPDRKNYKGIHLVELARERGHVEIVELLRRHETD